MLHITPGNNKLGKIFNISLPPVLSCPKNVPCASEGCYAKRIYQFRKTARDAWNDNYKLVKTNPSEYFNGIIKYLQSRRKKPTRFRWHTSGDIIDQNYYDGMKYVAEENKDIVFLAFTKNKKLNFNNTPNNLVIRFSNWGDYKNTTNLKLNSWVN